jgi:putative transposase
MRDFRRRLPHNYPEGKWLFLTWHLHGSLPHALYPPPGKLAGGAGKLAGGAAFVWMDRYLDTTRQGPRYLAQESVARIIVASLRRGAALGQYDLGAYVVMSNHVHALLLPRVSPSRLLHSLKGASAREANRILNRTGETFWQAESYDHWVRDDLERDRIAAYIENNPVKAGLVMRAEDYAWSSAGERNAAARPGANAETSLGAADTSVCATPATE